MADEHTDPILGKRFGNVEVKSLLGRGGMGAVYLGHHVGLDLKVAVKLLPDLFVGRSELVERFLREARVSARLNHPNIVSTLDVGQQNGVYYLVMEYVEGVDAQRLLDHEGRFRPMRAVNICGFVARALAEAHRQGVIHRDIKPANILIARDGKVRVTDFGLARSLTATTALTLTNQVVGTPQYMAPEQVRSANSDERVDIYALGITLWQFLTGKLPFDGPTPMAVLLSVVQDPLPMPGEVFGVLPRELREAVVSMTSKDPKRRLPNIQAVLAVLKKARDALRNAGMDSTAPLRGHGEAAPEEEVMRAASRASAASRKPSNVDSFTRPLGMERPPEATLRPQPVAKKPPVQSPAQRRAPRPRPKEGGQRNVPRPPGAA